MPGMPERQRHQRDDRSRSHEGHRRPDFRQTLGLGSHFVENILQNLILLDA